MVLLIIVIALFILYSLLIIYYWLGWKNIPEFPTSNNDLQIKISVIIPARNEEENISSLLAALQDQSYPKDFFEIIVVDDYSTDRTADIVKEFSNVRLIQLVENNINSYKKKAIEKGVDAATGKLIVTTDADCLPPENWLQTIAEFYEEKKLVFIVAPVAINCNSSILQVFQALDFMVLQGITGAAVHKKKMSMCNGANLAYEKKVFYEVGGFDQIDLIASGDDMLLMYKISKKYPDQIQYLKSKEAIMQTLPMKTWKEFFNQRIRWASKARRYEDKRILPVLVLVYFFNLSFLVLLIAGFSDHRYWFVSLGYWVLKTLIELPFFISLANYFGKQWAIQWFFFFQPLHIFYTILAGLLGQSGKYEWKGRKVK
jgi:cellulose synthase/poly-beta-1,6-N-acetylglucosamine synthase-like glycosyltransferase